MKLIIFSTRTRHHYHFIKRISQEFDIQQIVFEKKRLNVSYQTGPFFETHEDEFEDRNFDNLSNDFLSQLEKKSIDVYSINQVGVKEYLEALQPDLVWVYGTGRIHPHIIDVPRWGMVNLHGGISQKYRGLDSTLWAILNNDYHSIGLTIHYVSSELDTGDILFQQKMLTLPSDEIFHFRYKMTLLCTEHSISLIKKFQQKNGPLPAKPQKPGEYYSAMPVGKKHQALKNLKDYQKRTQTK